MNAHLLIIHFPVSLVLLAVVLDAVGVGMNDRFLREWAGRLLVGGAIAAFLAFATGESAKMAAVADIGVNLARLEAHQLWGSAGLWALIGATLLRTTWRRRLSGPHGWLNLAVLLMAAGLVVGITLSGMLVRHGD